MKVAKFIVTEIRAIQCSYGSWFGHLEQIVTNESLTGLGIRFRLDLVQSLTGIHTNAFMLVYHTVGHIMSMADGADCVEATMTAEEIQIEETDIEVVKNKEQPSKSNTS